MFPFASMTYAVIYHMRKMKKNEELFAFGARDGLHPRHGLYYLHVCILLKCRHNNISECGNYVKKSSSIYHHVRITGSMTTRYIYPEIPLYNSASKLISLARQSWIWTSCYLSRSFRSCIWTWQWRWPSSEWCKKENVAQFHHVYIYFTSLLWVVMAFLSH